MFAQDGMNTLRNYTVYHVKLSLLGESLGANHMAICLLRKMRLKLVKYAIRYVNKNVDCIRRDSLANKLLKSDTTDFWKELRRISRRKVSFPLTVDGVSGVENITDMWKNYYAELLNCLPIRHDHAIPDLNVQFTEDMLISCDEISVAIANLKNNKTCGLDGVQAEHLIHCSERIKQMLCMCFNSFLSHGFLPNEFMYSVLVPILCHNYAYIMPILCHYIYIMSLCLQAC